MIKALQVLHSVSRLPDSTAVDPLALTVRAAREGDVSAARVLLQKACTSIETAHAAAAYLHAWSPIRG